MIPYLILTATLSGSIGWCWGHRTARIRIVVIGATAEEDDAAFIADEHARFSQLVTSLDVSPPNDPKCSAT